MRKPRNKPAHSTVEYLYSSEWLPEQLIEWPWAPHVFHIPTNAFGALTIEAWCLLQPHRHHFHSLHIGHSWWSRLLLAPRSSGVTSPTSSGMSPLLLPGSGLLPISRASGYALLWLPPTPYTAAAAVWFASLLLLLPRFLLGTPHC